MTTPQIRSVHTTDQADKAELHCHINGLLCPAYVEAVKALGYCPDLDIAAMKSLYPVQSLAQWDRLGEFLVPHERRNGELPLEVLKLHLNELVRQRVRYVEIMLDSFLTVEDEKMDQLMPQYRAVADDLPDIKVGYLWAIGRTADREKFEDKVNRVISLWNRGYVDGVALAGDERACSTRDYANSFDSLAEAGVPIEIHAGEWCGPESVWDALEYGHARRIGHGLCIFDDPALLKYLMDNDIHVEFCPTSNLRVAGLHRIEEHPVFRAIDCGLNFSINTDDPGHFECSMNSEFRLLQSVRPIEASEVRRIFDNSVKAAFAS